MDHNVPSLYGSKLLSDVFICYGNGITLPAHKAILVMKSNFFQAAFCGLFLESRTNIITLKEEYPGESAAITVMLQHIYGKAYELSQELYPDPDEKLAELLFLAQIFIAADKYDVPSLRLDIAAKFVKQLDKVGDEDLDSRHLSHMIQLAVTYVGDSAIKKAMINFCEDLLGDLLEQDGFLNLLRDVTIFKKLRIMENLSYADLVTLMQNKTFLDVLDATPELSKQLLVTIVPKIQPQELIRKCSACGMLIGATRCMCKGKTNVARFVGYLIHE